MPTTARLPALALGLLAACDATVPATHDAPDDEVAGVELSITTVPPDVRCIHVVVTGEGPAFTKSFTVNAGPPPRMSFALLPTGERTFSGSAFSAACPNNTSPPAGAAATWVSEPVTTVLHAGATNSVTLDFWRNHPVDTPADFHESAVAIGRASNNGFASGANGKLYAWGNNSTGLLGTGRVGADATVPQVVAGVLGLEGIAGHYTHACGWKGPDVWCWGRNTNGQLGIGTRDSSVHAPRLVARPWSEDVVAVTTGYELTCALVEGGRAYCWGVNGSGQLGVGDTNARLAPAPVVAEGDTGPMPDLEGFTALAASFRRVCGLRPSGVVNCWGHGGDGRGTGAATLFPSYRPELSGGIAISGGDEHACMLRADGKVFCFGSGDQGQLGRGHRGSDEHILQPVLDVEDAVALASGRLHTCALHADGHVSCWGYGTSGNLGDGASQTTPHAVTALGVTDAVAISAGGDNTCALRATGGVLCWGENERGQVGHGGRANAFVPTEVELP